MTMTKDAMCGLRILFVVSNWYGSNARSCAESLRRLGCDVLDIDQDNFFPLANRFSSKVLRRMLTPHWVEEFNQAVLATAENFPHDIFLAMGGGDLQASTLRALRARGVTLYNYYPDTSAFEHGKRLTEAMPEYDCVFYTKPFWYADATRKIRLRNAHFIPHGYDPVLHRPFPLSARDREDYGHAVSYIATHHPYKEKLLADLVRLRPRLDLSIWGDRWAKQCKSPELRRYIRGYPLYGERYSRAIAAAQINLAIMCGVKPGSPMRDLTTNRTYTIPACGGFMLHERNPEVLELYEEGKEIGCFESAEELADSIEYFLAHPVEREEIAQAGYSRCVPAYSYDNRMAELLRWHAEWKAAPSAISAATALG